MSEIFLFIYENYKIGVYEGNNVQYLFLNDTRHER
jgi:hypothetical protein